MATNMFTKATIFILFLAFYQGKQNDANAILVANNFLVNGELNATNNEKNVKCPNWKCEKGIKNACDLYEILYVHVCVDHF